MRAGDVLRGGGVLLRGGCLSCAGRAVLSECPAFDHACLCGFLAVSYVRSRLLFVLRQTGRLAGCCVPIPPWVEIAGSAFSWCRCGYLPWWVHFGFVRFFMAISTGNRDVGTELRGGRGWRRGLCASLRNRIGLVSLSAGRTLGLRAPDCAKESSTLWTLLRGWPSEEVRFARRGCVGADSPRRHPGTIGDLTGSDKRRPHCGWPGRSCGRSNIAVRTIA